VSYCATCGGSLRADARFCASCGVPITATAVAQGRAAGVSRWAVASLVLSLASVVFFVFFVPELLAVVFGVVAVRQIRTTPGLSGYGMAIAGITLGTIMLLAAVVALIAVTNPHL
jgi:Domain of unknown function (DUF4190)